MPYLKTLIDRFDTDKGHPIKRSIDVLDMIEYSITYPSCNTITGEEIRQIETRVNQLLPELNEDPIFARRIEKWWKNRGNYQDIAKHVYKHGHDYIDSLHYHEEITSIRKTRIHLIKQMKGEKSTLDDHGLFGSTHHHT